MRRLAVETQAPLERLESCMTPWVIFVVVPVFAFANAGLTFPDDVLTAWLRDEVALGVVFALVLGKPLGVLGATLLATRTKFAVLPARTTRRHPFGLSMCAGVGFTVVLFVGELAFSRPALTESATLGILVGSTLACLAGFLVLRTGKTLDPPHPRAQTGSQR